MIKFVAPLGLGIFQKSDFVTQRNLSNGENCSTPTGIAAVGLKAKMSDDAVYCFHAKILLNISRLRREHKNDILFPLY